MKTQNSNGMIRTSLLTVQMIIIAFNLVLIAVVINKRKCKTISMSMWTLMVAMIIGSIILDMEVLIQYFTPTLPLCLLGPWFRELGFVIFYGAIDLKLYRILMQFRTRKAHCWTITDKDLLKYLLFGVVVVIVYLTAWTAVSLNFFNEGWMLVNHVQIQDDFFYTMCKPQWWNHVTEFGELLILTVGLYYGNSARNARVQFEERRFLFYAITAELTFSTLYNTIRTVYPIPFHQDVTFIAAFTRSLLTNTLALVIIFAPKIWYQKQVNAELKHSAINQELSESLKADMVDKDFREMNISEMTSDEIREELSRVYVQMGILRDKTVCKKNPHISKRKGGKKLPHRRFSLQSSIKIRKKNKELDSSEISETNETNEISKSPEDSVVSNEEAPAVGSGNGSGICSCHSTTGIHQTTCNEFNDGNGLESYRCVAFVDDICVVVSRTASVILARLSFEKQPTDQRLLPGQTAHFSCLVNSQPLQKIIWLKDNSQLVIHNRMTIFPSGALEIDDVLKEDNGAYRCNVTLLDIHTLSDPGVLTIVENEDTIKILKAPTFVAKPYSTITLEGSIVHVKPLFIHKPEDTTGFEKENITLECKVTGKPPPRVVWLKNGDKIKPDEYIQVVNGTNLKLYGLLKMDSGIFQCLASNSAGNIQSSAFLNVLHRDENSEDLKKKQHTSPKTVSFVSTRLAPSPWINPIKLNDKIYTVGNIPSAATGLTFDQNIVPNVTTNIKDNIVTAFLNNTTILCLQMTCSLSLVICLLLYRRNIKKDMKELTNMKANEVSQPPSQYVWIHHNQRELTNGTLSLNSFSVPATILEDKSVINNN